MEKDSCGGKKTNFVLICKAGVRGRSPWGARPRDLRYVWTCGGKEKKTVGKTLAYAYVFQQKFKILNFPIEN